jgi:N-acetylglucosamine kinase-like BadF-type ATPase
MNHPPSKSTVLIAESGSTKTEWRLINRGTVVSGFRTSGFNPNVQTPEDIENNFHNAFITHLGEIDVDLLHFYGAGLSGKSQQEVVRKILSRILPDTRLFIWHDLQAAARSTGHTEGIVCILGTGSNSCRYKDGEVLQNLGGHGWIFGDEGSGADLGKNLLKGILQGDFPDEVQQTLEKAEQNPVYEIKISVHKASKPNVRLASLAKWVGELQHIDAIREMIKARFLAFLDTTVCRYDHYQNENVDFIGSIGFFFREILQEACDLRGVTLGKIIKNPVDELISYHLHELSD